MFAFALDRQWDDFRELVIEYMYFLHLPFPLRFSKENAPESVFSEWEQTLSICPKSNTAMSIELRLRVSDAFGGDGQVWNAVVVGCRIRVGTGMRHRLNSPFSLFPEKL